MLNPAPEHALPPDRQPGALPRHVPQVPRVLSRRGPPRRHLRVRPHEHRQHPQGWCVGEGRFIAMPANRLSYTWMVFHDIFLASSTSVVEVFDLILGDGSSVQCIFNSNLPPF